MPSRDPSARTPRAPETRARDRGATAVAVALGVAIVVAVGATGFLALRTLDAADDSSTRAAASADRPAEDDDPSTTGDPSTTVSTEATTTTRPTTTTTTQPTTTTTQPTTTTTTAPPAPVGPRPGGQGAEVAALQQRLVDLGFWLPAVDGHYGSMTSQAVMAFQKSAGIGRDGLAGPNTLAALEGAQPVQALEGGDHVEIDLERQLMFIVRGGRTFVFNTSTGRDGWRTPPGRFTVTREIDGVRHAPLGDLYRPKYFNGGIALHGSSSIPGHPASHGCARLHDAAVDMIWADGLVPVGTPVWVY